MLFLCLLCFIDCIIHLLLLCHSFLSCADSLNRIRVTSYRKFVYVVVRICYCSCVLLTDTTSIQWAQAVPS